MKIVFFGTPPFAATILEHLVKCKINVVAAVTKPDKKQGRHQKLSPSAVKVCAEKLGLPLFQPEKARDPSFVSILKELKASLFVVAAYSEIFNEELLALPPLGCINVHASLLPKYRGAAPIERAIMAGEKESGVTIMKMVRALDAGDMYAVAKTPIPDSMTAGQLYQTLAKIGAEALVRVIHDIEAGTAKAIPQESEKATYAEKVKPSDGVIDWNMPCETIHNQIRGLTPKPGAFCYVMINEKESRLIIKKSALQPSLSGAPGTIINVPGLVVGCKKGALALLEVQLEGKSAMEIEPFLRGIAKEKLTFTNKKLL